MSASPPPMLEDDDLDEDLSYEDDLDLSDVPDFVPGDIDQDDDDDDDGEEEEEEDVNADFDVTGMSSKLHTIPKAAIHLAPKDVRIPPTEPKVRPDVDEVEMANGDDPSEVPDSLNPKIVELPEFSDSTPNSEIGTKSESPSLPENATSLNHSDQDDLNNRDEAELTLNTIESESKPVTDSVDDSFASFGDFASAFPTESSVAWSQPIENPPADTQADPTVDEVPDDPSFEADDDDDDDDDEEFGEFTDFSEPPTIPNESCLSEEPSLDSMQCILSSLQPMISQVISRLFESSGEDESVIEAVEPLNFSKDHVDDEIWEQICDIQSTPALTLSWTKSKSHSGWLQSVRIDPNNMVFETRHRLRGSSPSVPAFATGMGLLEPIRVSNPDNQTLKAVTTPDSLEPSNSEHQTEATEIPPVQFDWQTSGLTNPLESGAHGPGNPSSSLLEMSIFIASLPQVRASAFVTSRADPPHLSVNGSNNNSNNNNNNSTSYTSKDPNNVEIDPLQQQQYHHHLQISRSEKKKLQIYESQMKSPNTQRRPPTEDPPLHSPPPPTTTTPPPPPPTPPLRMEDTVVTKESSPKSAQKILGSFPLLDFMQASVLARPSASPVSLSSGKPQEFLASFAQ